MSAFELLSWLFIGFGVGFGLATLSRRRAVPLLQSLVTAGTGGLVGGITGRTFFPLGPFWGDLHYNASAGLVAAVFAAAFVIAWRLVMGLEVKAS
jgi:hypothetical protein